MAEDGHFDSGKSATAGHMMFEFDAVNEDTMDDLEDEASNAGWESSKYAWIFDKLDNERESGDKIDVSLGKFETDDHVVTLIGMPFCFLSKQLFLTPTNCPGHHEYTKNMLSGTVGTDAALLVVSAIEEEFDAGVKRDGEGQMREHIQMAYAFGVK